MGSRRRAVSFESVARDARLLGVVTLAAALLTVALIVLAGGPGPLDPGELLPYFQAHRARYMVSASVTLLWLVTAIPFIAATREMLGGERRALGAAAMLLATCGAALLGFGTFVAIGAFFALDAASSGIAARLQLSYQAAIWRALGFLLSDPGLMALGGGQVLFAVLA